MPVDRDWKEKAAILETECGELECLTARLQAELTAVQRQLKLKRENIRLLAPIHALTDDVLALIFEHAYLHHFPYCRLYSGRIEDSPLIAAQVCKRWRSLAVSLSSIWSCIHITPLQSKQWWSLWTLRTFLQRSRSRRLSIIFACYTAKGTTDPWSVYRYTLWPRFKSLWAELLPACLRWENLAIFVHHTEAFKILWEELRWHELPSLEFLQIMQNWEDRDDIVFARNHLAVHAPALKHFRSQALKPSAALCRHLTELKLDEVFIGIPSLTGILASAAPQLVRLVLRALTVIHPHEPLVSYPITPMPRLRYLVLYDYYEDRTPSSQHLLPILLKSMSALETLICTDGSELGVAIGRGEVYLPTLHTLMGSLLWPETRPDSERPPWRNLIEAFPSLENLQLEESADATECLGEAIKIDGETSSDSVVWPDMRSLIFAPSIQHDHITAFLQHRERIGRALSELVLLGSDCLEKMEKTKNLATSLQERFADLSVEIDETIEEEDAWDLWHKEKDVPNFAPWQGELSFEDQF